MAEFQEYIVSKGFKRETPLQKLNRLEGKEREEYIKFLESRGLLSPTDDGFFGELADRAAGSFVGAMEGLGATANEIGLGSWMQDYFSGVLMRNQQWNAPEDQSAAGYIGGAIGSAFGSTAATLGAATAGTLLGGPAAGIGAGIATGFAQTFGSNVQRNREAGYSEDKAYGMAFLESAIDSLIENAPTGAVGKGVKIVSNLARIQKITKAGKKELLNRVGQKISAELGETGTRNILVNLGKEAISTGAGEAVEEGLQYLNSYVMQKLGSDPNASFSMEELADAIKQGFIGGFALGGVQSSPKAFSDFRRQKTMIRPEDVPLEEDTATAPSESTATDTVITPESVPMAEEVTAPTPVPESFHQRLIEDIASDLGITVSFFDQNAGMENAGEFANGFYDKKTKTIYLDRNDLESNVGENLGHELKHYIDDNIPELAKAFDDLWRRGQTEEGKAAFKEMAERLELPENIRPEEFGAVAFGKIFTRPDTWKYYAEALENNTPGMGERFLHTIQEFIKAVKNRLAGMVKESPEAEQFFNNVQELEKEAGRMMAELRKTHATQENTKDITGTPQLDKESLGKESLVESSFANEGMVESSFNKESFDKKSPLSKSTFGKSTFGKSLFEESPSNETEEVTEVVSKTENTTAPEEVKTEVVSAENAQTTAETVDPAPRGGTGTDGNGQVRTDTDGNNALAVMREAFADRTERLKKTGKGMLWTDIAREYADGPVLSKEATSPVLQEIIDMAKEDYRFSESRGVLYAISQNPNFTQTIRKKAESAIKFIDKKIADDRIRDVKEKAAESTEVQPDEDIRKAAEKSAINKLKDRSAEIGFTFDQFYEKFSRPLKAILAEFKQNYSGIGNKLAGEWESAAGEAMVKAYMDFDPATGNKISTLANTYVRNAINDVNAAYAARENKTGGTMSLDQANEQGKTLSDVLSAEDQPQEFDSVSARENPKEARRRITESEKLSPVQKKIVDLFNQGLAPSAVIRKLGKQFGEEGHEYMSKEEFQLQIAAIRTVAEEEGVLYSKKLKHQQVNPVIRDGKIRDEYAYLLANKEYTPEKIAEWSNKAREWILKQGGIVNASLAMLNNKAPAEGHVAELARRLIINSDVFTQVIPKADRIKLYEQEIDARSEWGRTGRAMQLNALKLTDVASLQALLNKLNKDMPDEELIKLRNDIKDALDIDIYNLPNDIIKDKSKLDAVLRMEMAHKAKWHDKLYEYWINSILSGPNTHATNLLGNTANAVYELGLKRFTEAVLNTIVGKKDGATFGEFREMVRAMNWGNAWKAAKESFDTELLDPAGKFLEHNSAAIGGKTGRFIRIPGRSLKAADAFAKAIIQPMETAAYAFRQGVSQGLSGNKLQKFIQDQLKDKDSDAYAWGVDRAKEITFQEEPGTFIKQLAAMRETDGFTGVALRYMLPFIKTPYNILGQGLRKGPLGILNLGWKTGEILSGKRKADAQYIGLVAEQLLAYGALMAIYSLSGDDDELPFITGANAPYGSAEYGFKANKIPANSIRIGNSWFSYAKIEPLATGLSAIADAIQAIKDAKNGKTVTQAISDVLVKTGKVISDKSFIDSIGEIYDMVQDPERNISKPVNNLLASAMPNIYRQIRHSLLDTVQDSKSREKGFEFLQEQFMIVGNRMGVTAAVPKIDYFGREVKKDAFGDTLLSAAGRLILPVKVQSGYSDMDKAETLVWNYNQRNPDEAWYPSIPRNTFTVNKKKLYLAGGDYRDYAVDSGKLAHRQINNAIRAGYLNVNNPDKKDIDLIKKIFTRARKETQQKYIRKAKEF